MKKLIGIVGVMVIAMAMFFSINVLNGTNSDFDLASLIQMNTANAECITQAEANEDCYYFCAPTMSVECQLTLICSEGGGGTIICYNKDYR